MKDNYEGMTQDFARAIHQNIAVERNREMLPLRLRAVAGVLLSELVPIEIRIQILTALTYTCAVTPGMSPSDAGKEMSFFKELLLGEKGDTLAKGMLNDAVVQKVLTTSTRHKDKTVARVQEAIAAEEEQERKKVVPIRDKDRDDKLRTACSREEKDEALRGFILRGASSHQGCACHRGGRT